MNATVPIDPAEGGTSDQPAPTPTHLPPSHGLVYRRPCLVPFWCDAGGTIWNCWKPWSIPSAPGAAAPADPPRRKSGVKTNRWMLTSRHFFTRTFPKKENFNLLALYVCVINGLRHQLLGCTFVSHCWHNACKLRNSSRTEVWYNNIWCLLK